MVRRGAAVVVDPNSGDILALASGTHGSIGLTSALRVSCNSFFCLYGNNAWIEEINAVGQMLGLGQKSGAPIAGEYAGIPPGPDWLRQQNLREQWSTGQTAITSIGQGFVLATPLQMASSGARLQLHRSGLKAVCALLRFHRDVPFFLFSRNAFLCRGRSAQNHPRRSASIRGLHFPIGGSSLKLQESALILRLPLTPTFRHRSGDLHVEHPPGLCGQTRVLGRGLTRRGNQGIDRLLAFLRTQLVPIALLLLRPVSEQLHPEHARLGKLCFDPQIA